MPKKRRAKPGKNNPKHYPETTTVESNGGGVFTVRIPAQHGDWEKQFALISDCHIDARGFRLEKFNAFMDEAKKRGAKVFIGGDLVDAMQSSKDKRAAHADLLLRYLADMQSATDGPLHYFDVLVEHVVEVLTPYAHNIGIIFEGNHEMAISRHYNMSLLDQIVAKLNDRTGARVLRGGYQGWVQFKFYRSTRQLRAPMFFTHGKGGGGEVTHGVLDFARLFRIYAARIIWTGHVHYSNSITDVVHSVNAGGKEVRQTVHGIRTPTFSDDRGVKPTSGYGVERHRGRSAPIGGWFVKFRWVGASDVVDIQKEELAWI